MALRPLLVGNPYGSQSIFSGLLTSKKCLEVCRVASEVSNRKEYRDGEVIADGESDQVVVNTLAGIFDVKKVSSLGNSAQLVGSMTEEALRDLTEKRKRYNGRFGWSLTPRFQ